VTGAYNKSAHVIDTAATSNSVVRCKYDATYNSQAGKLKVYNKEKKLVVASKNGPSGSHNDSKLHKEVPMDCRKQVTLGCWAPLSAPTKTNTNTHTMALAYRNCIYLYSGSATSNSKMNGESTISIRKGLDD